jgi:4,5-DOPA dioxygenase extradiol
MTAGQPALFVPHGAPTFALRPGAAGAALVAAARTLARPCAIVIVSPHWDTATPTVGFADRPETLYDFWGFPPELYALRYPATSCREAAQKSSRCLNQPVCLSSGTNDAASTMAPGFRCA